MTNERKLEILQELTDYTSSGNFDTETYVQLLTKHVNEGFVTSHQFLIDFIIEVALSTKNYDLLLLAVNTSKMVTHYEINELSYEDYRTLEQLKIKAYCYYVRYVDRSKRSEAEKMIYCYQDSFGDGKVYEYQAILDRPSEGEDDLFAKSMVDSYLIKCLIYGNELSDENIEQLHLLKDTLTEDINSLFDRAKEEYRLSFADVESSKVHLQSAYELSLAILHQCFKKNKFDVAEHEKLAFYILNQYSSVSKLYIEAYLDAKYRFDSVYRKTFNNSKPYFTKKEIRPIKNNVNSDKLNTTNVKNKQESNEFKSKNAFSDTLIISLISLIAVIILASLQPRTILLDSLAIAACFLPLSTIAKNGFNKKIFINIAVVLILIFVRVAIIFNNLEMASEIFNAYISNFFSAGVFRNVIIPGGVCFGGTFITKKFIKNSLLNAIILFAISFVLLLIIRI